MLLGGAGSDELAVLRFRPAVWTDALECYVAELVVPERGRQGLGRALTGGGNRGRSWGGATHMDLGTGENDVAARALYESLGFDNRGAVNRGRWRGGGAL